MQSRSAMQSRGSDECFRGRAVCRLERTWAGDLSVGKIFRHVLFIFKAEDGIRDHCVTGVQTCALPIFQGEERRLLQNIVDFGDTLVRGVMTSRTRVSPKSTMFCSSRRSSPWMSASSAAVSVYAWEIGRASCRERGWISVAAGSLKKK